MIKRISISFSENVSSDEDKSNQNETSKKQTYSLDVKKRKSKGNIRQHLLTLKKPSPEKLIPCREEKDKSKTKKKNREVYDAQTFEIIPPKNAIKIKKIACISNCKNGLSSPQKQRVKYDLPRSKGDALLVDVSLPRNVNIKNSNKCASDDSFPESEEFEYIPGSEDFGYVPEESNSPSDFSGISECWEIKTKGNANNQKGFVKSRKEPIAVKSKSCMIGSPTHRHYIDDSQAERWKMANKPKKNVNNQNGAVKPQNESVPTGMKGKCGIFSPDFSRAYVGDSQESSDFAYRFNECKPKDDYDSSDSKSSASTVIVQNIFYQKEQYDKGSCETDINKNKLDPKNETVKEKRKNKSKLVKRTESETWKERKYREIAAMFYKIPQTIGFKAKTETEKSQRCGLEEYTVGYLKDAQSSMDKGEEITNVQESRDIKKTSKPKISKESIIKSSSTVKIEEDNDVKESRNCDSIQKNKSKERVSKSSKLTKIEEVTDAKECKRTVKPNIPKKSEIKTSDKKLKNTKVVVNIPAVDKNKVFKKVGVTYVDNNSNSLMNGSPLKSIKEKVGLFPRSSSENTYQPKVKLEKSTDRKTQDKKTKIDKTVPEKPIKEANKNIKVKPRITHLHDISFEVANEENFNTSNQSEDLDSCVTRTPTGKIDDFSPSDRTDSARPSTEASTRPATAASPEHQIYRSSSPSLKPSKSAPRKKKTVCKPTEDTRRNKSTGLKTPDSGNKIIEIIVSKGNCTPTNKNPTNNSSKQGSPQKFAFDESGKSPRRTNKSRVSEYREDEQKRSPTPQLYIDHVSANRNVSAELLNKFNSGSEMSSILYEKRTASPNVENEPKNIKDGGSKSIGKNKLKPLVDKMDRDEVQTINTKEKLKKFNMGGEMTLALYGTSNIGDASAASGQPKPVSESEKTHPIPVNRMQNPVANQGENLHPTPATFRDSEGNVISADMTERLDYKGNPINRVIADNLLNASTNPDIAAVPGLSKTSPIIIYCPIDYRKFQRGRPAYNYNEEHITPHLDPIDYQPYHQPSHHQNFHVAQSGDRIPQLEDSQQEHVRQLMYVPNMDAGQQQQVGGRPIEYHPMEQRDCQQNVPGWNGRKIGFDSSSGAEMAHILYGKETSSTPAPNWESRGRPGCDRTSNARRNFRVDDGVESTAKWRPNVERRPCGIYPGLIVDDGNFDM